MGLPRPQEEQAKWKPKIDPFLAAETRGNSGKKEAGAVVGPGQRLPREIRLDPERVAHEKKDRTQRRAKLADHDRGRRGATRYNAGHPLPPAPVEPGIPLVVPAAPPVEDKEPDAPRLKTYRFAPTAEQAAWVKRNTSPAVAVAFEPKDVDSYHPHGILADDRCTGEEWIASQCRRRNYFQLDVGGSVDRNQTRHNVWTTAPIILPSDLIRDRKSRLLGHTRWCNCLAQDCKCIDADIASFIHSAYYCPAEMIAAICANTRTHSAYSLQHDFDSVGSFCGEADYACDTRGYVTMRVAGNAEPYTHDAMGWMRRCTHIATTRGTLTWAVVHGTLIGTPVYYFVLCPDVFDFPDPPPAQMPFEQVMQTKSSYADLKFTMPNEDIRENLRLTLKSIDVDEEGYMVFGSNLIFGRGSRECVYVPLSLIGIVASKVLFKPRTPENLAALFASLQPTLSTYNLPPQHRDSALLAAIHLGYFKNLSREFSLIRTCNSRAIEAHAHQQGVEKWAFKDPSYYNHVHDKMHHLFREPELPEPTPYPSRLRWAWFAAGAVASLSVVWRLWRDYAPSFGWLKYLRPGTVIPFRYDDPPSQQDVWYPGCLALRSVTFRGKLPAIRPESFVREPVGCSGEAKLSNFLLGIGLSGESQQVNTSSTTNENAALRLRCSRPRNDWHAYHWYAFAAWVRRNMHLLFPGTRRNCVRPISFSKWLGRWPLNMQLTFLKAHQQCVANELYKYWKMSCFVKREKGGRNAPGVDEVKAPRAILSSTPHFNVLVGPFAVAMAEMLKRSWNSDHFITYPGGLDAAQLGTVIYDAEQSIHDSNVIETDYGKFDSSRHRPSTELELEIYAYFGSKRYLATDGKPIHHHLKQLLRTSGTSRHGVKFSIVDMLASGRPTTTVGNTIINGLVKLYSYMISTGVDFDAQPPVIECACRQLPPISRCCPDHYGPSSCDVRRSTPGFWDEAGVKLAKSFFSRNRGARPYWSAAALFRPSLYRSFVMGDDSLQICQEPLNEENLAVQRALGFTPEDTPRLCVSEATFCSARPYHARLQGRDTYVFAPKLGRMITRFGWFCDPPVDAYRNTRKCRARPLSYVRGTALGLENQLKCVPGARSYVSSLLSLTTGSKARQYGKHHVQIQTTTAPVQYHPSVLGQMLAVYGLFPTDFDAIDARFQSVTHLPAVVRQPLMQRCLDIDFGDFVLYNGWQSVALAPLYEEFFKHLPVVGLPISILIAAFELSIHGWRRHWTAVAMHAICAFLPFWPAVALHAANNAAALYYLERRRLAPPKLSDVYDSMPILDNKHEKWTGATMTGDVYQAFTNWQQYRARSSGRGAPARTQPQNEKPSSFVTKPSAAQAFAPTSRAIGFLAGVSNSESVSKVAGNAFDRFTHFVTRTDHATAHNNLPSRVPNHSPPFHYPGRQNNQIVFDGSGRSTIINPNPVREHSIPDQQRQLLNQQHVPPSKMSVRETIRTNKRGTLVTVASAPPAARVARRQRPPNRPVRVRRATRRATGGASSARPVAPQRGRRPMGPNSIRGSTVAPARRREFKVETKGGFGYVTGSDKIQTVELKNVAANARLLNFALTPLNPQFHRAEIEAALWQRFEPMYFRFHFDSWMENGTTDARGALVGFFDSDINSDHPSGYDTLADATTLPAFSETPIHTSKTWTWRPRKTIKQEFYIDPVFNRFSTAGHFMLFNRLANADVSKTIGEVTCDYGFKFALPEIRPSLLPGTGAVFARANAGAVANTVLPITGDSKLAYIHGYPRPLEDAYSSAQSGVNYDGNFTFSANVIPNGCYFVSLFIPLSITAGASVLTAVPYCSISSSISAWIADIDICYDTTLSAASTHNLMARFSVFIEHKSTVSSADDTSGIVTIGIAGAVADSSKFSSAAYMHCHIARASNELRPYIVGKGKSCATINRNRDDRVAILERRIIDIERTQEKTAPVAQWVELPSPNLKTENKQRSISVPRQLLARS
jgi:hypothetical protein